MYKYLSTLILLIILFLFCHRILNFLETFAICFGSNETPLIKKFTPVSIMKCRHLSALYSTVSLTLFVFMLNLLLISSKRDDSVVVILCRNEDLEDIKKSLISFESTFNSKYHYPYAFLNDKPWEKSFIDEVTKVLSSDATFDIVSAQDWEMPNEIDINKAKTSWQEMKNNRVPYADLQSYHNMCRFFSRAFFNQPVVKNYKYYWRIEPGVEFHCNLEFDPFERMDKNGYKYGFTIAIREFMSSIPTLGKVTKDFQNKFPEHIPKDINRLNFMFDNKNEYNGCHFWSNFEIGSFEFLRSPGYQAYAKFLNENGGFYYERWGDAPVHSLGVYLFLDKSEVHFFEDIGYTHAPFTHCPRTVGGCNCDYKKSIDFKFGSCLSGYLRDQQEGVMSNDFRVVENIKR